VFFYLLYFCFVQKIRKIKYKEIDFKKYDLCIKNAKNTRFEAFSWYLNLVANKNWNVLVLNDYQAVLPLPIQRVKRKLLKKMVVQPHYCQQLGVFYNQISKKEQELFLDFFKKENVLQYQFNTDNTFVLNAFKEHITIKNNYVLDLNRPYNEIKKNYKKGLKQNIKKAEKASLTITKDVDFNAFKTLKLQNSVHKIKAKDYKKMEELTDAIIQKGKGDFFAVYQQNKITTVAFYIITKKRIIYLLSATNQTGKKNGATAFLMDYIIKNHCQQPKILDFEGSSIKGIADFFKSFGATNEPYYAFIKN